MARDTRNDSQTVSVEGGGKAAASRAESYVTTGASIVEGGPVNIVLLAVVGAVLLVVTGGGIWLASKFATKKAGG